MKWGDILGKDIIGWLVGLVPLLIFYFEYRSSKKELKSNDKEQGRRLDNQSEEIIRLNEKLLRESETRNKLEKKMIEENLKLKDVLYKNLWKMLNDCQKDLEKEKNIKMKLIQKLSSNNIIVEEIDIDETSFEEWEKENKENK